MEFGLYTSFLFAMQDYQTAGKLPGFIGKEYMYVEKAQEKQGKPVQSTNNDCFLKPKDSAEFLASFSERGNSFQTFWNDCCEQSEKGSVSNTELHGAYIQYCERDGLEAYSRQKLYDLLSGISGVKYKKIRQGSKTVWGHTGIKLRTSSEWNSGTDD